MDATQISTIEALPPEQRKTLPIQDKYGYVLQQTGMSANSVQLYPWDDPVAVAQMYLVRRKKMHLILRKHKPRKAPAPVARCPYCGKRESRCKCS